MRQAAGSGRNALVRCRGSPPVPDPATGWNAASQPLRARTAVDRRWPSLILDGDVGEAEGVVGAGDVFLGGFEVESDGVLPGVGPHHCQGGGVAVSELVVGGDLAQGWWAPWAVV